MLGTMRARLRVLGGSARAQLPALVITLIIAVVGPLFVASYSLAMANPTPHGVPVATVGPDDRVQLATGVLDADGAEMFRLDRFDDTADAIDALARVDVYAVIDLSTTPATLTVSSAAGVSVARVVEQYVPGLETALGEQVTIVDAHPLAPRDPDGLALFYLALGATILGFVGAIQTRVNAPGLTLRGEITWDVIRSAVVALLMTLVIGPFLGIEQFPVLLVWPVLAMNMLAAALVYSFWRVSIGGRWALLPTWIMFVVIANPSSGGAVAPELLPPFYEIMGRWLPTGATVRIVRDVTYFPGVMPLEPLLVLAAWCIVSLLAFTIVRFHRQGAGPAPTARPAASSASSAPADDVPDPGDVRVEDAATAGPDPDSAVPPKNGRNETNEG
ncbi:ABC transporter permease [Pseudoclavibacter chungangensis]|uniref:ABC transporter permease n=1 Tax=Pseudoclavibacter chungangensis TaxID=587635 RepID=A0A7J5C071_9MICO|nr:ABC transporter permease [Pseudoclavibacter chungangensis]KAB1660156.1 ABC transporter permease [Pseudoclavibacter chungangensis]NYJ66733.1 hypothetical protein [Pseudoclavibacter chungangensis]